MTVVFEECARSRMMGCMYIDFSALFHATSKDLNDKGRVQIPQDPALWPEEWKTVQHKSYGNLPKIALLRGTPKADFFDVLQKRHSSRDFTGTPLKKDVFSQLLLYACGALGREAGGVQLRSYASGGGLFPIEIYPVVLTGDADIPAGIYHYNVREHALDILSQRSFTPDEINCMFVYEWVKDASVALVMTAVFARNQVKYGERGYRYVLVETGHIGENIYLTAEALGLRCCAMAGVQDSHVERLLDIDGVSESVVHSVILGS